MPSSLQPHVLPTRPLQAWDFPGKHTGVGCYFLLQEDLPDPGFEPMSPALAGKFITTEPPGKCCRQKVQFDVLRREKFNRNFFSHQCSRSNRNTNAFHACDPGVNIHGSGSYHLRYVGEVEIV